MAIDILLIDDDPDFSIMLRTLLRGKDFQVHTAYTGEDGIEACRQETPEVVILDLLMPEMDGWATCHAIREFSQVPILILSVIDKPELVARALDEGADDYLVKPVPLNVLVARLKTLARRSHP